MEEYIFLFLIAFVWVLFATVQDLRTREIANWLNFSLIAFVLAYRAFYASFTGEVMFFVYGVLGVMLFSILGFAFYYGRVFGGGDVKLLMGLGGVLPYREFFDFFYLSSVFIFALFLGGAIWTMLYGIFLIRKNWKSFSREFGLAFKKGKYALIAAILLVGFFEIMIWQFGGYGLLGTLLLAFILLPFLFIYAKAIERSCMVQLKSPKQLTEGDWLEKEVRIGNRRIRKSVHGLSAEDIRLLRKAKKKVWIKDGVPFTPAFIFALLALLFVLRYSPF